MHQSSSIRSATLAVAHAQADIMPILLITNVILAWMDVTLVQDQHQLSVLAAPDHSTSTPLPTSAYLFAQTDSTITLQITFALHVIVLVWHVTQQDRAHACLVLFHFIIILLQKLVVQLVRQKPGKTLQLLLSAVIAILPVRHAPVPSLQVAWLALDLTISIPTPNHVGTRVQINSSLKQPLIYV